MKKKLISVFFGIYILLGVLGFFVITYVGSHLLENQLEKSISSDMYQTAHRIAESDLVSHSITSSDMEEIQNNLSLAPGTDTIIWIINSNGQLLIIRLIWMVLILLPGEATITRLGTSMVISRKLV